ncbi:hypothetical protein [Burkholderia ubonensis]|uniref:Secreted protein n=1 Tax=Burkholderia ubonensis subsp. mesacidophila TaxID=265293 RepID=A0A2A4FBS7_9BURK|nr:hypothetical protein [Burkholderia ubonensis]PCE30044.1 hypothetical protein BZL54_23045 [Burkholderia ubonensis subsp. mesacidophila]
MLIRKPVRLAVVCVLTISIAQQSFAGSCTMRTQMESAQEIERTRRQASIEPDQKQLELFNQLEQACLENFPDVNTQGLLGGQIISMFLNKVKQTSCKNLADKARKTTQEAMAQAQQAAQKAIDDLQNKVTGALNGAGVPPGATNVLIDSTKGMINDAIQSESSRGILDQISGSLGRLFQ